MTHKIYDKLVRDNIPAILEANNLKFKVEYLSDEKAEKYIIRKLSEEVAELVEQIVLKNRDGIVSELADIISITMKIGMDWDIDIEDVLEAEDMKSAANGFFFDNCILKYVDEPNPVDPVEEKQKKAKKKSKKQKENINVEE